LPSVSTCRLAKRMSLLDRDGNLDGDGDGIGAVTGAAPHGEIISRTIVDPDHFAMAAVDPTGNAVAVRLAAGDHVGLGLTAASARAAIAVVISIAIGGDGKIARFREGFVVGECLLGFGAQGQGPAADRRVADRCAAEKTGTDRHDEKRCLRPQSMGGSLSLSP